MDKLIELLNEYEKEVNKSEKVWSIDNDGDICRQTYEGVDYNEYTEYMNTNNLISKSFGFIQWLVDNDKIDRDKIIEKSDFMPIVSDKFGDFLQPTEEQELLMLLSIQENPIEFLCSVIK